ncbi:MAG: restriction endonuclease [Candidatus Coatesbacteria bacterium]|mgnify:CR=1 FL=1
MATTLDDEVCAYLVSVIVHDLGLAARIPEMRAKPGPFFASDSPEKLRLKGVEFWAVLERLVAAKRDAVTYFSCLAALHKSRLKYARILRSQPIPTMDQVGPRGLLQYGSMSPQALTGLLLWRKWLYDIDNRAAQETGYLFEPIIAHSIGGAPFSSSQSPIRRHDDRGKRRQVDCVRDKRAYEFKMRVTIAASGQGRWREEMDFPLDCRKSGFKPVLLVFDGTRNPKLTELTKAFLKCGGETHVGDHAWQHLEDEAGDVMARFLDIYVRGPIQALLKEVPGDVLPELRLKMNKHRLVVAVGGESMQVKRASRRSVDTEDPMPVDVGDESPGV